MTSDLLVPTFTKNVKVGQPPTTGPSDMIAVWVEWQTTGANTITVKGVSDTQTKTFQIAVGPTVAPTTEGT